MSVSVCFLFAEHTRVTGQRRQALEHVCWSGNHGMIKKKQLPVHVLPTLITDTSRDFIGPRLVLVCAYIPSSVRTKYKH